MSPSIIPRLDTGMQSSSTVHWSIEHHILFCIRLPCTTCAISPNRFRLFTYCRTHCIIYCFVLGPTVCIESLSFCATRKNRPLVEIQVLYNPLPVPPRVSMQDTNPLSFLHIGLFSSLLVPAFTCNNSLKRIFHLDCSILAVPTPCPCANDR